MLTRMPAAGALLLALASTAPRQADAQILRTACTSPSVEYCISFTQWEFEFWNELPDPDFRLRFAGTLFGPGTAGFGSLGGSVILTYWLRLESGLRLTTAVGDINAAAAPPTIGGDYSSTVWDGTLFAGPSTVTDLTNMELLGFGVGIRESGLYDPPPPAVIPEPGTWLLLITGLVGLGLLALARRRHLHPF